MGAEGLRWGRGAFERYTYVPEHGSSSLYCWLVKQFILTTALPFQVGPRFFKDVVSTMVRVDPTADGIDRKFACSSI